MRMLSKLLAGIAAAGAMTVLLAGPAMADPPPSATPPPAGSIVGVGSDTIQFLFDQLSKDYNATHSQKMYSWDAVPNGSTITPKKGCTSIPRPTGSGAGI